MGTEDSAAGLRPEAAFTDAAERFFALLKTFGEAATGSATDWASLAGPLATQFEQWLRFAQPSPTFAAARWPGAGTFGPLPLGAAAFGGAAASGDEALRAFELYGKLGQLQAQLASHWSEIANTAVQRFVARVGGTAAAPGSAAQALRLYELWVDCAEEAYAATVHRGDFGHLQAEITNTSAALLLEQRRHAETLARAFGLPTRSEVDALNAQLRELRRELEALREPTPSPARDPDATPAERRGSKARGAGGTSGRGARPRGAPSRGSRRRAPARGRRR